MRERLADFAHSWAKARSVFPETLAEQQKVVACVAWPVPSTTTRALRRGLTDARVVRQWNRERLNGGGGSEGGETGGAGGIRGGGGSNGGLMGDGGPLGEDAVA